MGNNKYLVQFSVVFLCCAVSMVVFSQIPDRAYGSKLRESNRLLELAKNKIQDKQYRQALVLLNGSLQYQTDNIEAYFHRALVKENLKDPEGAFTDYQIVLLLDSTYREAAFNRAKLRYKQGQYQRAVGDFKKVLVMGSSGTQRLYFKGTPINKEGQVPIHGITTTYSMEADLYNYIGLCYQSLGQYKNAINAFDTAISLNSNDANFYVNRGLSHADLHNSQESIADFEYALKIDPEHAIARFNLTRELETTGGLGINAYDKIIVDNPEFASAYVNRAMAKLNVGDIEGAMDDYNQAIQIDSHDAVLYINRALAKEKAGKLKEALTDYNLALSLDPSDAKAYRSRGRVLFGLEKFHMALEDLNYSINLDPSFGGTYFNRALVHRKLGDQYNTCRDLEQAHRLGTENASKALAQYCADSQ